MSWTGRIFWLLAFEEVEGLWLSVEQRETRLRPSTLNPQLSTNLHLFPAFTVGRIVGDTPVPRTIGSWEIVSSYSSATAPVSHRIKLAKN